MARVRRVAGPKRQNNGFLLLVAAVFFISCGGYSLHSYKAVGGEWGKGCPLAFVQDSISCEESQIFDLYVGVRYSAAYKYKNLWLQVSSFAGNDSLIFCDTLCCNIFDDKGHRNGSTAGSLYQVESYVAPLHVPCKGVHTIVLQHIMSDSLLQGVYDVGVKLVPRGLHQCAGM